MKIKDMLDRQLVSAIRAAARPKPHQRLIPRKVETRHEPINSPSMPSMVKLVDSSKGLVHHFYRDI